MYTLLVILTVFAAMLMIGIVLVQESKGGGLSSNFKEVTINSGIRGTTSIVEKMTWGLAAMLVLISILCSYFAP